MGPRPKARVRYVATVEDMLGRVWPGMLVFFVPGWQHDSYDTTPLERPKTRPKADVFQHGITDAADLG